MMNHEACLCLDLENKNIEYKGAFTAYMDHEESIRRTGIARDLWGKAPDGFLVEVWGLIYIDVDENWKLMIRLKFPSKGKQVHTIEFGKKSSETEILQHIYSKFPMKDKVWVKNPDGTGEGLLKVMREADMIESVQIMVSK